MSQNLPRRTRELYQLADQVGREVLSLNAEKVDAECMWPKESFRALSKAGLLGLQVPSSCGGQGEGLLGLAAVTEALGRYCSSSALCFGMHCVATAVIASKATPFQQETYLKPIAEGRHVTTLALSESGTGSHFYLPETELRLDGDHYVVNGCKQFVTNGGHADSYVISTGATDHAMTGEFSCLVLDAGTKGCRWLEPWNGLGMRGNSSRGLAIEGARVPRDNLLGVEGDQIWYVFEVVAPYFLTAMAGTYLGIATAAVEYTTRHLQSRHYSHSGESLAENPVLQERLARMWINVEKTRGLIYTAARLGDSGDPRALSSILACKADAGEMSVRVTDEAMTLGGGIGYRDNSVLARLLRDARASNVMSPTTTMLLQWTGRSLLDLPIL